MRFGFVLGVLLKLMVGCSAAHHGAVRKLNSASPRTVQAVSDAQHVLQSAAQSDDVELRAMALSFLVAASEEDRFSMSLLAGAAGSQKSSFLSPPRIFFFIAFKLLLKLSLLLKSEVSELLPFSGLTIGVLA